MIGRDDFKQKSIAKPLDELVIIHQLLFIDLFHSSNRTHQGEFRQFLERELSVFCQKLQSEHAFSAYVNTHLQRHSRLEQKRYIFTSDYYIGKDPMQPK